METGKLALTNGGFMVYNSLWYECGMANNNFNNTVTGPPILPFGPSRVLRKNRTPA